MQFFHMTVQTKNPAELRDATPGVTWTSGMYDTMYARFDSTAEMASAMRVATELMSSGVYAVHAAKGYSEIHV